MEAHRAWAEVDLDALSRNLGVIRARAGDGVRVMLVVKADAYGHGAVAVAHHAIRCGISSLGVGTGAEALELRSAGIRLPILVLGTVVDDEVAPALRHGIQIGVHASDRARSLQELAKKLGTVARVHLNVDTGMGRLGVSPPRALSLLREIHAAPHLELGGVMTHVSATDGARSDIAREQIARFDAFLAEARAEDLPCGWIHAANSAALFTGLAPHYDTVRPGISAYGVLPEGLPGASELQPVLSFKSQVCFLKDLEAGTPVGYGSTWKAPRATRLATVPVGYDDGVPWRLGNRGEVLVRGRRAPIVGRVSMDYTTIDVGHIPDVHVGDPVTLFGRDGDEVLGTEEIARRVGTIPYEITCSISRRVTRVYHGGESVEIPSQRPRELGAPTPRPAPEPKMGRTGH